MAIIRQRRAEASTSLSTYTMVLLAAFIVCQLAFALAATGLWYQAAEPCVDDYEDTPEVRYTSPQ